VINLIHVREPQ